MVGIAGQLSASNLAQGEYPSEHETKLDDKDKPMMRFSEKSSGTARR